MRTAGREPHRTSCLGRAAAAAGDSRGVAFVTTLYIVVAVGMMLIGFAFLTQNEARFAGLNRNSTQALSLAEAGAQEALRRLPMFGVIPGVTSFTNSLAASNASGGGSGTVAYQAVLRSNPAIFPILSTGTFAVTRNVRVLEQAVYKNGLGNVIFGRQAIFQGNASPITGDVYALTSVSFAQYQQSPLCASTATATNLISPQVMAGTTIGAGAGSNVTPPCGAPVNAGTYTTECASGLLTEVPPTPCPGGGRAVNGTYTVPVNWHPMTPIAMTSTDFTAVVTAASLPPGVVSVVQATQNGVGVTYTPAGTYTPSYWTSVPSTNGKVMLITATQPFCVNASTGSVTLPSPAITGTCAAGYHYYGNQVTGTAYTTRFLDWGLVTDDLSRGTAQKFFQAPACTAPCANQGNQNGIRYIPLLPSLNVLAQACVQNLNPGTNVFDKVNTADGITCANPPIQTINSTSVTFTGTRGSPESLVIDNAGQPAVSITGSLPGNNATCNNTNFDNYNWGQILATGDLNLQANLVLSGFIYTPGNVFAQGNVLVRGGIFSASIQGSSGSDDPNEGEDNENDFLGTANFCATTNADMLLSPLFFNFSTVSWQDRPANKP